MKTPEIVIRQHLIIHKLRRSPQSFEEISNFLAIESDIQTMDFHISKRTFQREINYIRSIYGIEIVYDTTFLKYKIVENANNPEQQLLLEKIDLYSAFNAKESLSKSIIFEPKQAKGTQFLKEILEAIETKKQIKFTYHKYYKVEKEHRVVEPYFLKEYKHRWYVVGLSTSRNALRTFSLDRIAELSILKTDFQHPALNAKNHFETVLGIVGPNGKKPEKIVITVTSFQAKYLKSLPWHASQELVEEDAHQASFSFYLVPTYDFEVKLLSLGSSLLAIEPQSLKKKVLAHLDVMRGSLG